MKTIALLTVISLLVGCSAIPNLMRARAPDMVHTSSKTPREISICIAKKWENYAMVNQSETENGYSLTATSNADGSLENLVDIENDQQYTVTKVYKFMYKSIGPNPFFTAVASCQ